MIVKSPSTEKKINCLKQQFLLHLLLLIFILKLLCLFPRKIMHNSVTVPILTYFVCETSQKWTIQQQSVYESEKRKKKQKEDAHNAHTFDTKETWGAVSALMQ